MDQLRRDDLMSRVLSMAQSQTVRMRLNLYLLKAFDGPLSLKMFEPIAAERTVGSMIERMVT